MILDGCPRLMQKLKLLLVLFERELNLQSFETKFSIFSALNVEQ
jgi:hypothetical protein